MKKNKVLRIIKDFINKIFGFKNKKIKKPKLTLIVNNVNKEGRIHISKNFSLKESDISEEGTNKLMEHFEESIKKRIHPWSFEKNLDYQLKGSDRIYYLYLYYIMYLDWYAHHLLDTFREFWFENNSDEMIEREDKINKECLRMLKYEVLGFYLINSSKEEKEVEGIKELKEVVSDSFDEAMFNTKSDNLPLLLKAWEACQEKLLLEDKEKLKAH